MNTIELDLAGVGGGDELLAAVGAAFGLGGPGPEGDAAAPAGWGDSWEALADHLCFLDAGGIWGTGRPQEFPLQLLIRHSEPFRAAHAGDWAQLVGVLDEARTLYAQAGLVFRHACA